MTTPNENPAAESAAEAAPMEAAPVEAQPMEAAPVAEPAPPAAAAYEPAPAPQAYAPPAPPAYAAPAANPMPNTWMNITAFVTGILGLAIIPIIFGHIGVNQSNKGRADLKWMGIVGLVLGYLTVVAYLIITAVIIGAFAAST